MSRKYSVHKDRDDCNASMIQKCYIRIAMAMLDSLIYAITKEEIDEAKLLFLAELLTELPEASKAIEDLLDTLKLLMPTAVANALATTPQKH